MTGLFITLEGGEGAGKSTLAEALSKAFSARDIAHIVTREPGGTPLGEKVRALALTPADEEPLSPLAMALLMNAARADHLDNLIRPSLARGETVICDRFADSTRAYQSVQGGVSRDVLLQMEKAVLGETKPDLTFLLDADPEALLSRRVARGGTRDVFEGQDLAFHRAIRTAFLEIADAEPERVKVLSALQPADALAQKALSLMDRFVQYSGAS